MGGNNGKSRKQKRLWTGLMWFRPGTGNGLFRNRNEYRKAEQGGEFLD